MDLDTLDSISHLARTSKLSEIAVWWTPFLPIAQWSVSEKDGVMTDRSSLAGNSSWFHAWCLHPHLEKDIVSQSTKSSSCFSNCWDHLLKMPRSRQFLMSKPSFCCQENQFFFPRQRHPDFHFSPGSNGIPIRRVVSFLSSVALLGTSWCLWPFLGAASFDWQRYSARLPFRDLAFAQNRTLAIFPLDVPFQRMLQLRIFWNGLGCIQNAISTLGR